ncbi:leucine--tRNA ligase [bacterium]|nr:leucine--tRNA ligase [bacterium]
MTTYYNHQKIEKKWQAKWDQLEINRVENGKGKKKYILGMFPYPSGDGLHVGHPEGYTATDIASRYYRFQGFNVLQPMGWDSFGLPAENFAIKEGVHPREKTKENIKTFKRQIKSLGFSYDWSREVNTSSPDYYKWTQWLFLKLYEKDLAYKKKAPVNWCDSCKTVLANEQVVQGKCERCENDVIQKDLNQWFFKTTEYVEELLEKIDGLDWSQALKTTQKNWIGKSEGARLKFKVLTTDDQIEVFTTRPDTLFGATYMVLAPEHELVNKLKGNIENFKEVEKYIEKSKSKSNLERTDLNKEKSGIKLKGLIAINPANDKEIPIYIADYVLTNYGTGAIMAVPAHDERDYEFAKKYNLEIIDVIKSDDNKEELFTGDGILINSDKFDGLTSSEAIKKITNKVDGYLETQYKIRDWLVSRQRYWGSPIPIIYCDACGTVPVPEKNLPVILPDDVDFKPTGQSPLVDSKTFHDVKCPKCGDKAKREVDTMDTFVCSSWYFLRYCDASNNKEPFSKKSLKYWLPVDLYIGGMEHAVGHLIYSRFITKFLRDQGYLNFDEPFTKIRNQGLILAEDSRKMSKRWGNVINPDEVIEKYGADTLRLYEMFMGPLEDSKPWNKRGIIGIRRFLEKVYKYSTNLKEADKDDEEVTKILHKTIKKVTEDIENLSFNTAIASMMEFMNTVTKLNITKDSLNKFLILLAPFAPHICEEINEEIGNKETIFNNKWPKYDEKLIIDDKITIAIQVNGKLRDTIIVNRGISEKDIKKQALDLPKIKKFIDGNEIKKFIYVPNKLINLVV